MKKKFRLLSVALFFSLFGLNQNSFALEEDFNSYIETLYQKATLQNYKEETLQEVFPHLHPITKVLDLDHSQAGIYHKSFWFWPTRHPYCAFCYIHRSLSAARIHEARAMYRQKSDLLQEIYQTYHVRPEYLVSLWGLESNFGKVQGNFPEFSALATLAYDHRRRSLFESEFFAALKMVDQAGVPISAMKGSWAGAMGQCQFMPSKYLTLAVDYDHKGYADIWHNQADALASIANFLKQAGWRDNSVVIQAVTLSNDFKSSWAGLGVKKPLKEWLQLGVIPREQLSTPSDNTLYSVLAPDHSRQYAFLVDTHNFNVIMNWNHSKSYALTVGLLAREITLGQRTLLQDSASE